MPLRINIVTQDQQRIKLEADRRETFLKLKTFIKVIKGYPIQTQKLFYNGVETLDEDLVASLQDGEILYLKIA